MSGESSAQQTSRGQRGERVALVVGGTAGIGRATALRFARDGVHVAVAARHEAAGHATCAELSGLGVGALFVAADVRDEASVAGAVAGVLARFGRLDFAVNCAGAGGDLQPVERASLAVWDEVMAVNARGVWLAMRSEIPALLASGGGAIVNLCSVYGMAGKAAHHAYVASKHAVLGLSRSVALEYADRGVRVNALCAGLTRTESVEQAERLAPALVQELVARHPMARMASTDEIAAAAVWLCSSDAGFVTGAPLVVDGGYLAA